MITFNKCTIGITSMANHGGDEKSVGGFEQYMKETARSFKECRVKNSLRRNSLQKKTLGIEKQRKISSLLLDKEERELREKYRQLQVDQKVSSFTHSKTDDKEGGGESEGLMSEAVLKGDQYWDSVVLNPYPITFRPSTSTEKKMRGPHTETDGTPFHYRRRQSIEFEDLILNTNTGGLKLPPKNKKNSFLQVHVDKKLSRPVKPHPDALEDNFSMRKLKRNIDLQQKMSFVGAN
ncbi:uncharacterized protein LOC128247580 isoform X2 [Octopus bimaculoides]|uniref:uncharacterized protein LOC128247580 isoform X2 n=1 Tax=Octopus bimaculoides TaxID=37653 RepID=UPI0022DEA000|nr:uncharacterized protein LOC128247580 isoform X2 [Octopus bimaculoides]